MAEGTQKWQLQGTVLQLAWEQSGRLELGREGQDNPERVIGVQLLQEVFLHAALHCSWTCAVQIHRVQVALDIADPDPARIADVTHMVALALLDADQDYRDLLLDHSIAFHAFHHSLVLCRSISYPMVRMVHESQVAPSDLRRVASVTFGVDAVSFLVSLPYNSFLIQQVAPPAAA